MIIACVKLAENVTPAHTEYSAVCHFKGFACRSQQWYAKFEFEFGACTSHAQVMRLRYWTLNSQSTYSSISLNFSYNFKIFVIFYILVYPQTNK